MNDYSNQMMLKKEIIKIYNNDKDTENYNNTFLLENEHISIDLNKIKKVYSLSKKLRLEIMTFDTSEKFINIEIDPFGYVNSKREKKDGITYFGYNVEKDGGNIPIDYALKNNDNYFYEDSFNGRHFMIKFNPDDLNYYVKDLGRGFGTFIKIQEWTELKNNLLLNIGENYIVFSLGEDDEEEEENEKEFNDKNENSLNIKIFSVNTQQKVYKFLPSDCPITIGRSNDNNIFIDDDMLSRIHCTIDYNNEKWYVNDGFAKNGIQEEEIKKSTNNSWIYAYDEIPITDRMVFKANHNLFICNLI